MKKSVLEDHKRKGKVFQPPLLSLGVFVETAWVDYLMPEFIWILLFIEKYGVHNGSRLSLQFSTIADNFFLNKVKSGSAAVMLSSYSLLCESDRFDFIKELNRVGILDKCRVAITEFNFLYPETPLSFLTETNNNSTESLNDFIKSYKTWVAKFYDRTSFQSSIVIANAIAFLIEKERLFIAEGNNLPSLNEILKYPTTDDSKRLSAFLRSTVKMCFNNEWYDRNNAWIKYYWNRSIEIEPCKL